MLGKIDYRSRAKQLTDYSGISYGKITPTDIDGVIDFRGQCFIFIELKLNETPVPYGQYKCFEAITNSILKPCLFIIAEHNAENPHSDIKAHEAKVRRCFCNRGYDWYRYINKPIKQLIDNFKEVYFNAKG